MILHHRGFPIRKSTDRCLFTAPRGLSQLVTSFFGSWCQGIHLMLFVTWTYCSPILRWVSQYLFTDLVACFFTTLWWQNCSFLPFFLERPISIFFYCFLNICSFALFGFQWSFAFTLTLLYLSATFHVFACETKSFRLRMKLDRQSLLCRVVGLDGLEPSTSRLSGARSNHLSYRPWWRWWDSNPWPPACRAGALPTELHPHGYILLGLISPWKLNNKLLFLLPNSLCPLGSLRIRTSSRHPWDISRSP